MTPPEDHEPMKPANLELKNGGSVTTWLRKNATATDRPVPCGSCNACCRAGYEVDLREGDDMSLAHHIAADDTPLLERAADGSCVYLEDGRCAVYDRRPQACRAFDCRALAYAGLIPNRLPIREAVQRWSMRDALKTRADIEAHAAFRLAALAAYDELHEVELAVDSASRVYERFLPMARRLLRAFRERPEQFNAALAAFRNGDAA